LDGIDWPMVLVEIQEELSHAFSEEGRLKNRPNTR
jgi:hypothetical protein